jgi:hypothetical protein
MPLQIRRGTAAERNALTSPLVVGELLYVTDQGKIYIGDGTLLTDSTDSAGNPGQGGKGLIVTGFSSEEAQDATAELFSNGTHTNITFTYNDSANSINAQIDLSSYLGDINVEGLITSSIKGSIFAEDSTLLIDAINAVIPAQNVSGTFTGDVVGDVRGSIYGDDSTLLIDGTNSIIPASVLSGTFTGNVIGNITGGTIEGSIITNTISSSDSSPISCDTQFIFETDVTVQNTLSVTDGGIFKSDAPQEFPLTVEAAHNDDIDTRFTIRRSRGTLLSPTALVSQDRLGSIQFNGFDGSNYAPSATIQSRVGGTVSSGVVPGNLRFFVNNTSGTEVEAMSIQPNGDVYMFARTAAASPFQIYSAHDDGTNASNIILIRSRGTLTSPTAIQNGDPVYDFAFAGYDGAANRPVAQIRVTIDGAVSSGITPGKFNFFTTNTSGVSASRVEIATTKTTFNNMPVLPTYADETAADTAIGGSGNRVNGMMYYDTALGAIRAVVGGSWTSL